MRPEPTSAEVRARLAELVAGRRTTLAGLSRMLGRHASYLTRFVNSGVPDRLDDGDRTRLAAFFDVPERELGKWDNPPDDQDGGPQ